MIGGRFGEPIHRILVRTSIGGYHRLNHRITETTLPTERVFENVKPIGDDLPP